MAAEYNGAGYIDYRSFDNGSSPNTNQNDSTIFRQRWNFFFHASNSLWRIQLNDIKNDFKIDYSFDGTNTYTAIPSGTNIAAQIFPTQYPPPNGFPAIAVWFAYCSGAYISGATNNLLCSLSQEAHPFVTAYEFPVHSKLESLDKVLHIPRNCLQFSDGTIYGIDIKRQPPVIGYKFGGVFSNGFVESAYNVIETTNLNELTLPKTFQLQQFRPKKDASTSNDVFVIAEFIGYLQSCELGVSKIGDGVQIQPNAFVDDYRGMKLDPPVEVIQYFSPSNSWLSFSPGSKPYIQYERRKLVQKAFATQSHYKKGSIIAVLFALTVIPLIAILSQRFFRRTSVNK